MSSRDEAIEFVVGRKHIGHESAADLVDDMRAAGIFVWADELEPVAKFCPADGGSVFDPTTDMCDYHALEYDGSHVPVYRRREAT